MKSNQIQSKQIESFKLNINQITLKHNQKSHGIKFSKRKRALSSNEARLALMA